MKRKIYERLLEWKKRSNGKTALLIDGARRVGKSYIAEEFAKNEYSSYVVVDFAKAKPALGGYSTNILMIWTPSFFTFSVLPRQSSFKTTHW